MSKYNHFKVDLNNKESTHTRLLELVGTNKRVLDIGCNSGYLAEALRNDFGCTVVGVEYDSESAQHAQQFCEKVIVGDLETLDFRNHFSPNEFDVILIADVLEHLRNSNEVLTKLESLCRGYFVISLPHIAHAAVILELLEGRFDYRELGLLDSTHVKFFTRKSVLELLNSAGLVIEKIDTVEIAPGETEFKTNLENYPSALKELIDKNPDSQTYQFIIKAEPKRLSTKELQPPIISNYNTFDKKYYEQEILWYREKNNELINAVAELKISSIEFKQEQELRLFYKKKFKECLYSIHQSEIERKTVESIHLQTISECENKEEIITRLTDNIATLTKNCEELTNRYDLLHAEYNVLGTEITRLRKFTPDRLPRVFRAPAKAMITGIIAGPLEPFKLAKKKIKK